MHVKAGLYIPIATWPHSAVTAPMVREPLAMCAMATREEERERASRAETEEWSVHGRCSVRGAAAPKRNHKEVVQAHTTADY